ncbi:Outer membrane receptor proteins, mostly Fe transport [Hyunsoonleella jejuensis]|uniref:Outer membrane receptor proteins, mostly Fe transport n=1 Tax=Hyunsoonleella jejuensis TaxID=419940 RepID=A0A1H9A5Y3_9FLAO|nr:TonB-dependent receptor [Hyunsoonleella jejuensis]SEP71893.1 Outer membrane receptor proteins, mostly Fe transport [Hyunsoonleella jejuensis]
MRQTILLLLLFTSVILNAQTGSVKGKLTDKEYNNEPLAFANVLIKGTTKGTTSDFDGLYEFNDIDTGTYTLVFSFVGYETQEIEVNIVSGEVAEINVVMSASAASLDEVVITTTTKRESETALLLEQKKAVEIKQSIGAEELSRKGVGDAAGAVAKISGISKQEGSNSVYVRGLGDRYLNSTMNGLALPSNDVNKKNIDLNLFSSDVIENVGVSKAYSARFYGDFSAGNIDITSKEYTGNSFFDVSLGAAVNSRAAGRTFLRNEGPGYFGDYARYNHNPFAVIMSHGVDPIEAETPAINMGISLSGGKSINFKDDSRLSVFITASFDNSFEYREGLVADYTAGYNKLFPETEQYNYATTATAMATALYRINSDNKLKFSSLAINSSSDQVGFYGTGGNGILYDFSDEPSGYFQSNLQFNQDIVLVNQLIGEHTFGKIDLDWGIGHNRVFAHEPDRKRFSLLGYDNLLDNDPNSVASFDQNNNFNNQRYFQNIEDEELNSRLSLSYKPSETVKLFVGYDGKTRERHFDNIRYGYKNINTSSNQITQITQLNNIFNLQNFVDGVYQTHVFNPIDPGNGITQTNFPGLLENTYKGVLNIYAGYFSAEINLSEKWLVIPGIRIENFSQSIEYDAINLRPNDPGFSESSENFALPSLNIKYAINDDQNLRFAVSKTVSVPEFKEIAPFVYEGISYRIGGNQDLLGTRTGVNLTDKSYSDIYNLDLKYEWFISKSEVFSLGVFAKQINDPINLVLAADATGTQRYFRTGEQAEILGAEIELRKNLILNEDEEAILSSGFNFTYMHTKQDLYNSIEGSYGTSFNRATDELEGASPIIVNADLSFKPTISENFKPAANLVFNYSSDRIFSLGSGDVGNVIEKAVPTLDFVLKNKVGDNAEINFSAKNLLDPKVEMIRENTGDGDVLLSSFQRGITVGLQLKYNF